jgi:sensor histidine kinase YesM
MIDRQVLLFYVLSALFLVFEIVLGFLYYKKVYLPIIYIKRSLTNIVDEKNDLEFSFNSKHELYPLANHIAIIKNRMRDLLDREYTAILLKKQAELNALQSQINPHFLYNTLESIRGEAIIKGVDEIARMTKALSNMFRYSISHKENIVTLAQELSNLENYLIIQQYRFSNKFIIQKNFDSTDPEIMECPIPNLTIQPIIENAIYHGLEKKIGAGTIRITVYSTQSRVVISIDDDGIGISETKLREYNRMLNIDHEQIIMAQRWEHESIGLLNVNERIKLTFGADYGLHIFSTLGVGTKIEITLPNRANQKYNRF